MSLGCSVLLPLALVYLEQEPQLLLVVQQGQALVLMVSQREEQAMWQAR
jgi:hypothetical protein